MKVQELVGSKVWVRPYKPETVGYIASIPKPANLKDIESSIDASIFRIDLPSGDVIVTSGSSLYRIAHAGYIRESGKRK